MLPQAVVRLILREQMDRRVFPDTEIGRIPCFSLNLGKECDKISAVMPFPGRILKRGTGKNKSNSKEDEEIL